ncbi:transposase [Methanoplanus endosymbiosus]|uniref:Transposase n=1 Tax=Methanoplanus endosymbiosus TaxID=33865 RepID=A0A9E7PLR4_9EURY|nr:transposase [Methanoplanus endosymbiosus]UUX91143.1 transposase [Methanoplanus endosymbiosus]UUX92453.1 transposase [Methanoplanus endosymbiosus]UUX92510.1 transposase [Methanoplanus endosymbiosus]UUX92602.1 transposase [Methanoplanus endosymbiosus]UUX93678.1 transposase [Methanoplanus endosymbiosus]
MVAVGLLRFLFDFQRDEIRTILLSRGISISTGEISNLSKELLLRFYALHKRHMPQMKSFFEREGGAKLHLDGTGEAGNEIVFMAKDGDTGITMDAQIIPTESKKYVKIFLNNLKSLLGDPIVIVRDMSKQIRDAAFEIFPDVKHQICQYHFVKNLGKTIFKTRYSTFRKDIVKMRILSQIKKMKGDLSAIKHHGSEKDIFFAEQKWIILAIEHLLICRERSSNYPFGLPYFEIMNRILDVQIMAHKILEWNMAHKVNVCEIKEFSEKLDDITNNAGINSQYSKIQKIWEWFEKVRITLRVGRHLSQNGSDMITTNAQNMRDDFEIILNAIDIDGVTKGGELLRGARQITNNCRKHMDELFVEVKDTFGNVVDIMRDNNIEERGHRWSRMHIRRRTGRNRTTNEMAQYGALMAIFSNLENETYVREILYDIKDFIREIQDITAEEISSASELVRPYAHKEIVHSDSKRLEYLEEFINLLEGGRSAEKWLSKFNISNRIMTP